MATLTVVDLQAGDSESEQEIPETDALSGGGRCAVASGGGDAQSAVALFVVGGFVLGVFFRVNRGER